MTVGVVILNYNQAVVTERCVRALLAQEGVSLLICVVDNASTDHSADYLSRVLPVLGAEFFVNPAGNAGYAAGNNLGLRYLRDMGAEWLVVANPDTIPATPHTVRQLVDTARTVGGLAFWGPAIRTPSGRVVEPYRVRLTPLALAFMPLVRGAERLAYRLEAAVRPQLQSEPQLVYRLHGCWIMASRETWEAVDYFDEGTFLYYEEAILAERCRRRGVKMYYLPAASVIHDHRGSQSDVRPYALASRSYLLRVYFGCSERTTSLINSLYRTVGAVIRWVSAHVARFFPMVAQPRTPESPRR